MQHREIAANHLGMAADAALANGVGGTVQASYLATAQVHAILELAEQQRIANLIALSKDASAFEEAFYDVANDAANGALERGPTASAEPLLGARASALAAISGGSAATMVAGASSAASGNTAGSTRVASGQCSTGSVCETGSAAFFGVNHAGAITAGAGWGAMAAGGRAIKPELGCIAPLPAPKKKPNSATSSAGF